MNGLYKNKTRINYYDLDFQGKIKLSALLRMVHIAADENATDLKIGFAHLHPLNISFVIQRFNVNIIKMPAYNDVVTIRTWPASTAKGTFTRKGDMYNEQGEKIMEWASLWILFDLKERKLLKPSALPIEIPPMGNQGVNLEPTRIRESIEDFGKLHSRHTHVVRYSEVDTNIHMNNSIYGDLIGNAIFPKISEMPAWKNIQIAYQAETYLGDEIKINACKKENIFLVTGENKDRICFTARVEI